MDLFYIYMYCSIIRYSIMYLYLLFCQIIIVYLFIVCTLYTFYLCQILFLLICDCFHGDLYAVVMLSKVWKNQEN